MTREWFVWSVNTTDEFEVSSSVATCRLWCSDSNGNSILVRARNQFPYLRLRIDRSTVDSSFVDAFSHILTRQCFVDTPAGKRAPIERVDLEHHKITQYEANQPLHAFVRVSFSSYGYRKKALEWLRTPAYVLPDMMWYLSICKLCDEGLEPEVEWLESASIRPCTWIWMDTDKVYPVLAHHKVSTCNEECIVRGGSFVTLTEKVSIPPIRFLSILKLP